MFFFFLWRLIRNKSMIHLKQAPIVCFRSGQQEVCFAQAGTTRYLPLHDSLQGIQCSANSLRASNRKKIRLLLNRETIDSIYIETLELIIGKNGQLMIT